MTNPQVPRVARRARRKERLQESARGSFREDPQVRRMLTSHIHCGEEMRLVIVNPALPCTETTARNECGSVLTYRCACGFSFDQGPD